MRTLAISVALLAVTAAWAQNFGAGPPEERMFTIESETDRSPAGGITVRGWVTNRGNEWVRGVVLIVQSFGASGQVTDETLVPVSGEIGPGTRRWFEAPAPPGGATVRVRVYSFEYLRQPSG